MSAVQRLITYQLWRGGQQLHTVTGLYSERQPGYEPGDAFLPRELAMRASVSAPVQTGDTLVQSSTGTRYRVGVVERLGQRYVLELSREA